MEALAHTANRVEPLTAADDTQRHYRSLTVRFLKMIISHGRECCFVLAVIFTAYAAFQSSPLQTRKANLPQAFFSGNSLVTDYFWGHVSHAFNKIQDSDVTFIMYYAPWDAASMEARWEFEKTAKYYHEQVFFVAVNCWWPEGECRSRFPKIQSFPILIAYHSNGKGVQFHGNVAFPELVNFLDYVIDPLVAIHSRAELYRLLAQHDAVVLGYFNFDGYDQPSGYTSFYIGALKALERDPLATIKFAVISNPIDAHKFGMMASKTVHLYLWNSTQAFVSNETFSSQKLLNWAFEKKSEAVKWLAPPGAKSLLLSSFLEYSPTLIMLTPRYSTSSLKMSPFYYMLKEIALDYFNCNNSSPHIVNIVHSIRMELQDLRAADKHSPTDCSSDSPLLRNCCASVVDTDEENDMRCHVCSLSIPAVKCLALDKREADIIRRLAATTTPGCISLNPHFTAFRTLTVCCARRSTSDLGDGGAADEPNWKTSVAPASRYGCMLLNHSRVEPQLHFPSGGARKSSRNFTGSGCPTNTTLSFVVMDSLLYSLFFEKLGVDVLAQPSKTAVVIVHVGQELHYTMDRELTGHNLREFIANFTGGHLRRHHRSSSVATAALPPRESDNHFSIREITGSNFDEIVMDVNKDVVLMVYAPWCAFCYGIAHIYLAAARYFSSSQDVIFARINGDANDLPWEFTVQKYPTIMMLPANRKANSVSFPEDLPVTTTNLINFVLSNCKQEIKMRMALSLCNRQCIVHNKKIALKKIRQLLHRYRTLDGRLAAASEVLEGRCVLSASGKDNLSDAEEEERLRQRALLGHVDYVRHLVEEMCRARIELTHAKTLHLVLTTTDGNHLTRKQLDEITNSHRTFAADLVRRECKDMMAALKQRLSKCGLHDLLGGDVGEEDDVVDVR